MHRSSDTVLIEFPNGFRIPTQLNHSKQVDSEFLRVSSGIVHGSSRLRAAPLQKMFIEPRFLMFAQPGGLHDRERRALDCGARP